MLSHIDRELNRHEPDKKSRNEIHGLDIPFPKKSNRIYIPKEIGIYGCNDKISSAIIINPLRQGLFKVGHKSFTVFNDFNSENTGHNYYIELDRKTNNPESGKLYLCVPSFDSNIDHSIDNLKRYIITLDDETECFWDKDFDNRKYYQVDTWDISGDYYEVIKEDDVTKEEVSKEEFTRISI